MLPAVDGTLLLWWLLARAALVPFCVCVCVLCSVGDGVNRGEPRH